MFNEKETSIDMILTAPLGMGLGCTRVRVITGAFTVEEKSLGPGITEGSQALQQPSRPGTPVLFLRMLRLPKAVTSELMLISVFMYYLHLVKFMHL